MSKNPLLDEEFLKELYRCREKEVFAKIVALTLNNDPIEEIQGQVTGGSISLDGSSSVRRTCNLTLVAKDLNINQYYWGLKTKFKLYIGLRNIIGWDYDDIIWFPMGVYVISTFSTSQSVSNYTISITGKDKMTLLNGELSGSLFASVDFGKEEYYQNGITTISYIPVKNIIREAVHAYANETWENIVINDLEDYGIELLDYNDENPMYLFFQLGEANTKIADNVTKNGAMHVYPIIDDEIQSYVEIQKIGDGNNYNYDPRIELDPDKIKSTIPTKFYIDEDHEQIYTIAKITKGQTCGYRLTDITYPGDLILGIGEPITAMLDKIVTMLGNFEYFYDIDGRFVFQRKPTFIDKTWNNIKTGNQNSYVTTSDETYVESAAYSMPITWTFGDSFLVTAYSNTPALSNVRNDFSIWGTKKSITGSELPVHLRYAVDKKPTYYKTFDGKEWTTEIGSWWIKKGEGIVDVTYDQLVNLVKEEARDKIRKRIIMNITNFTPTYGTIDGLQKPIRLDDGSWTSGWWDIRDWHDYYVALTGEEPRRTMKWYSHNNMNGCVSSADIHDRLVSNGYTYNSNNEKTYVWLLTINNDTKRVSHGHGGGPIALENGEPVLRESSLYVSYKNNEEVPEEILNNSISTSTGNGYTSYKLEETKFFMQPYSGCSDNHTYYYFYYGTGNSFDDCIENNYSIYFYAPNFPAMTEDTSFEEYIEQEVARQLTKEEIDAIIAEKGYRYVERTVESLCDWREIIFQMALDYRKHNHDDDFHLKVRLNNGLDLNNQWYYPDGKTGYEQYYVDMEGFWRQLYCPPQLMKTLYPSGVWTERAGTTWYATGAISADSESGIYFSSSSGVGYNLNVSYDDWESGQWVNSWIENQEENGGWNIEILDSPETLNFWFDFLEADEDADLVKYSVPAIGDRAKSVNDNMVKAIYFRETPNVLFTDDVQTIDRKSGYTYLQIPNVESEFNVSSQGKSAYDVMEEYINLYLYCIESISITSIPIYHLQPNTRVMVYDDESKINGEYLISKITIPLTYNGTMSVSATKSAETIY